MNTTDPVIKNTKRATKASCFSSALLLSVSMSFRCICGEIPVIQMLIERILLRNKQNRKKSKGRVKSSNCFSVPALVEETGKTWRLFKGT